MHENLTEDSDENFKKIQQRCDSHWHKALAIGKEQLGNLQTNLRFLKEANVLKSDYRILEIGCGIGTIVFELTKQGHDALGTDISREAITYGLQKYKNTSLEVQTAETLSYPDGSFNVVLSFDFFEHIKNIDQHLNDVVRILRPTGYYLFSTPNKYSNIIFETLKNRSLSWRKFHPSLHSPRQIIRRLKKHGFEVKFIKLNTINEFTLKKLKRVFGSLHVIFKRINFRRLPLFLQTNMYIIAKKIEK